MINSKEEYKYYLKCDKLALGRREKRPRINDLIWKFQIMMRKLEYLENCKKGHIWNIYKLYLKYRYYSLGVKLGFDISINTFGPGLAIVHSGLLIINPKVKIGENCRIHAGVNIGAAATESDAVPKIGNNIYIGPGAKLFGNIVIGNNVAIGANAVVNKSFGNDMTIAGIPAKVINKIGSKNIFPRATELIKF